jgi:para-aminobenzoate synthetase component I
MLNWGNQFNICCFLDNNSYASAYNQYEAVLAVDALDTLSCNAGSNDAGHLAPDAHPPVQDASHNAFSSLQRYHDTHKDWLFGHLGYDLKNEIFPLQSKNPDGLGFPDLFFFRPRFILLFSGSSVSIGGVGLTQTAAEGIFTDCLSMPAPVTAPSEVLGPVQSHFDQQAYIAAVRGLQEHIHRGDCYEVNFCRENFIENATVDPCTLFTRLNRLSPAPFAAYYRINHLSLACSSPERFLQKRGTDIISQPIKGTVRRDGDAAIDAARREALRQNRKERAENVMVVDLVRNDLSHTATPGTVEVAELFGIYSFAHVHHMISTVRSQSLAPFTEVISQAFPMGSMTGAPKLRVMQLIEEFERSRRGLFSGAVGYVTPEGDADFNVVIRSILYNAERRYLSFSTGSAITAYADPQKEWEECLLKAEAMRQVLEQ